LITSILRSDCNLLPADIQEIGVEHTDEGLLRGYCSYRSGRRPMQEFEFPGGRNPQSWLAFKLELEHKFATMSASEAARRLFQSLAEPDA
jgi:hypothetical protein